MPKKVYKYSAERRAAIAASMRAKHPPVEERFWAKVHKNGPPHPRDPDGDYGPCWLWTGALDARGYGRFRTGAGRVVAWAHRYALELYLERPLEPGMGALHTCDRRDCVRHVYEGNNAQNVADRVAVAEWRDSQ